MWFIGVEVEQETSAPPPNKNSGSAPVFPVYYQSLEHGDDNDNTCSVRSSLPGP